MTDYLNPLRKIAESYSNGGVNYEILMKLFGSFQGDLTFPQFKVLRDVIEEFLGQGSIDASKRVFGFSDKNISDLEKECLERE